MYENKIRAAVVLLILVILYAVLFGDITTTVIFSGLGAIIIETAMTILEKLEEDFNTD